MTTKPTVSESPAGPAQRSEPSLIPHTGGGEEERLRAGLSGLLTFFSPPGEGSMERFERIADEFYRETRVMAPGKDSAAAFGGPEPEERRVIWDKWVAGRVALARAALAPTAALPSKDGGES